MADTGAEKAAVAAPSSSVDSLLLRYVFLCPLYQAGVGVVLPVARSRYLCLTLTFVRLCTAFCSLCGASLVSFTASPHFVCVLQNGEHGHQLLYTLLDYYSSIVSCTTPISCAPSLVVSFLLQADRLWRHAGAWS